MKNKINKNFLKLSVLTSSVLLPNFVFGLGQLSQTHDLLYMVSALINDYLIPIAFSLALLYFFYGVAKYIRSEGTGKEEGKSIMVWGVLALFVMSSVWGLVKFIQDEFSIDKGSSIKIPKIEK